MPIPSNASSAASNASNETIGGVPIRARAMPGAGSKSGDMSKGRAWPCQPVSGGSKACWCRTAT